MSINSSSAKPWYKTTYRWGQTNLTEIDPVKCDLDFWRKQWKRTRVQGIIVNCGGIVAYYPSKYNAQRRAVHLGDRDYFKEFSDAAREEGLKVVARMDIRNVVKEFYELHPDWFSVDKAGNPITTQGLYFSCVNSDYYKSFIPGVLTEIIEKYHPEGFADNSWKGLTAKTICYCGNCREKFKSECGLDLPEDVDWDDPVYCEWVRWGYKCRLENWDLFNEVTQRVGGESCLWIGMMHADPVNSNKGFGDVYEMCKRSKIIFSDHQSRSKTNGFEDNSISGSLLRLAADENVLVPESMSNYVRGGKIFRVSASPAAEARMWMINGIAGGISPWYHHVGGGQEDRRKFEIPVPVFEWHEKYEQYLYNRKELANVGLVWSQANGDFYGKDSPTERVTYPWKGFYRALIRARIPFIPVNAEDISRYAKRLSTLILPDIAVLSDAQIDMICDFVLNGGNIVMTGKTATLDKNGRPSDNQKLWRLLGLVNATDEADINNTAKEELWSYNAHTYLKLPDERHEIFAGFEETDVLPFGGDINRVSSTASLKAVASYIPPFPIFPPEVSWIREELTEVSTAFAGTLESGARVVYLAADIDRCYGRNELPDHGTILSNAVSWTLNGEKTIEVKGSGYINCKLYRQDNRLIIHLINLSGCNAESYCEEFIPIGPVKICVDTQGLLLKKAFLAVAEKNAVLNVSGGYASLEVERIVDHEMIILE